MEYIRSAWLGPLEISFRTWRSGLRLHCPPKPNYPQDLPTVLGFRVYTLCTDGSTRIGQLEGRAESLQLDEEEALDLARQEYFYSQKQVESEVENILFAVASSGTLDEGEKIQSIIETS